MAVMVVNAYAFAPGPPVGTPITPPDGGYTNYNDAPYTFVIQFSEDVQLGSGTIILLRTGDSATIQSWDVETSPYVTVDGNEVSIEMDPMGDGVDQVTAYAIKIPDGAIESVEEIAATGMFNNTFWNFTTSSDGIGPVVSSYSPEIGSIDAGNVPYLAFVDNIEFGAGNISLYEDLGGGYTLVEQHPIADGSIGGGFGYTSPFAFTSWVSGGVYSVTVDGGAFEDEQGDSFEGISGPGTWYWTIS